MGEVGSGILIRSFRVVRAGRIRYGVTFGSGTSLARDVMRRELGDLGIDCRRGIP